MGVGVGDAVCFKGATPSSRVNGVGEPTVTGGVAFRPSRMVPTLGWGVDLPGEGGRIFLTWSGDLVLFFGLWWRRLRRRRSRQPLWLVPQGERGEEVWVVVRSGGMQAELKLERRDGRQSWSVATVGGVFFHGLKKTVSEVKEKKNKGFGSGGRNRNTCIQ